MLADGTRPPARAVVVGFAIAAATFAVIGILAAASQGEVTLPILWVERIGSLTTDLVRRVGLGLGFGAAFLAGTIAAFNPCGFALLPAYLGIYVGGRDTGSRPVARAVWVSGIVSLAFFAVFGIVGAAIAVAAAATVQILPWLGLMAGSMLIIAGAAVLAGWHPMTASGARLADRLGGKAGRRGVRGYAAFGVAYGLASLSCTLPVVFAVVGVGAGSTGTVAAALRLVAFAAGVAFVLAVVTVVAGVLGTRTLRTWRRFGSIVPAIGGILLLFSGAYTVYYWVTIGRALLF